MSLVLDILITVREDTRDKDDAELHIQRRVTFTELLAFTSGPRRLLHLELDRMIDKLEDVRVL